MSHAIQYAYYTERRSDPASLMGGDRRISYDLEALITARLGIQPITAPHQSALYDNSTVVVSINDAAPSWANFGNENKWLQIAIKNDMSLGFHMYPKCDVFLNPVFNPAAEHEHKRINPAAAILPIQTLPSRITPQTIREAANECGDRLVKNLKEGPITAIVVGDLSHYAANKDKMVQKLERCMKKRWGKVLLTTSPRTPQDQEKELLDILRPWLVDSFTMSEAATRKNPYAAFLGLADEVIVSGDSISMLGDVLASGKSFRIIHDWDFSYIRSQWPDAAPLAKTGSSFLADSVARTVKYFRAMRAEFRRDPIHITDKRALEEIPSNTRRPIYLSSEYRKDPRNFTKYLIRDILQSGGKDLDSDYSITPPPAFDTGLPGAVDHICALIRKKSAALTL